MKHLRSVVAGLLVALIGVGTVMGTERPLIEPSSAGDVEALLVLPHAGVVAFAFSPDGETLASVDESLVLRIWNTATGECVRTLELEPGIAERFAGVFSDDMRWVAVGLPDDSVGVWRISDGERVATVEPGSSAMSVRFSPDSHILTVARFDGVIELWGVTENARIAQWLAHESAVHGLAFSPDGNTLATSSINETHVIRIWSIESGEMQSELSGHRQNVYRVLFVQDGAQLLSASGDRSVILWDVASGEQVRVFRGHYDTVNDVVLSPSGDILATAGSDRTVRLWDFAEAESVETLQGHGRYVVRYVAFSPSGHLVASSTLGRVGGEIIIWGIP
ncbi:WD40 repeat domain-containing protein [Candidatus Bipolaricaulota bacterium]